MPGKDKHYRNTSPHFDGKRESIINDSTATQGGQFGITFDSDKEYHQEKNPFHLSQSKPDDNMQEFEKLMRNNSIKKL